MKINMFFSSVRFEERHGSGFQRRQPLARFLGSFFAAWQRMNIKVGTDQREPKARSMIVRRKSWINIS